TFSANPRHHKVDHSISTLWIFSVIHIAPNVVSGRSTDASKTGSNTYGRPKSNIGAGVSHHQPFVTNPITAGAEGCHRVGAAGNDHTAHNERAGWTSRRTGPDVHRRFSPGVFEPYSPPQCAGVRLRAGRLSRDAGERTKRTHARPGPKLL